MSESRRPSSLPSRWAVLTMPVVTVFCRAKGLPMATTNSPGRRSAERPSSSAGSFFWSGEEGRHRREAQWSVFGGETTARPRLGPRGAVPEQLGRAIRAKAKASPQCGPRPGWPPADLW